MALLLVAYYSPSALAFTRVVQVFRDGVQLTFPDQKPVIEAGRTLVPVRFVSEALGASVEWDEHAQRVTIKQLERTISLVINQRAVFVGNKEYALDVPAKILNGRTMVPLRFVSEVLGTHVEWNEWQHAVHIMSAMSVYLNVGEVTTIRPFGEPFAWSLAHEGVVSSSGDSVTGLQVGATAASAVTLDGVFSKNYIFTVVPDRFTVYRNTHNPLDYLEIDVRVPGIIEARGATLTANDRVRMMVTNTETRRSYSKTSRINSNKTYTVSITESLPAGKYIVDVFMAEPGQDIFRGYDWGLELLATENGLYFPASPVYKHNVSMFANNRLDLAAHTRVAARNATEVQALRELAAVITSGITDDYDKVYAVCSWVSDNIYYNWDGYLTNNYGRTDAFGTLESRRSVCQGYAELTAALIRSLGIPCKIVTGRALGESAMGRGWDAVNHTTSNHAWNEIYVNGRWIIVDTTWNSRNKYEKGEFKPGTRSNKYFDCTLEAFSVKHKILR